MSTVNNTPTFPAVKCVDATKGLYGFFTTDEKREHKRYWDGTDEILFGDKLNCKLFGLSMFSDGLQFIHSSMFGVSGETRSPDTVRKELTWTLPFATAFDCSTSKGVSNTMLWTLLAAITLEVVEGDLEIQESEAEKLRFYVSKQVTTEQGEILELTVLATEREFIDFVDGNRSFACNGIVKLTPLSMKNTNTVEVEAAATLAASRLFAPKRSSHKRTPDAPTMNF